MEIQLNDLLEKIKSEGVQNAEKQAKQILSDADTKASATIEQAKKEASRIIAEAQQKVARSEQSGKDALAQAARDLILNVQEKLKLLFQAVVADSARETYRGETLKAAIVTLVSASKDEEIADLSVQIPKAELDTLEKELRGLLAKEIERGVTIEATPALEGGFRLARKDGGSYYDFSAESIADILAAYVSPRLAEHLRKVAATL